MDRTPYSDRETEDTYQNLSNNSSQVTGHPSGWVGNQNYPDVFDAADRAIDQNAKTGKMPGIKLKQAPSITDDPELNPKYAPDTSGVSKTGWNRVAKR